MKMLLGGFQEKGIFIFPTHTQGEREGIE